MPRGPGGENAVWARKIIFGFRGPTSEILEVSRGDLKSKVKLQKKCQQAVWCTKRAKGAAEKLASNEKYTIQLIQNHRGYVV